jgi:hypothetical protein
MDAVSKGDLDGFPTYRQANDLLDKWVRENPNVLREVEAGKSFEGRPIKAYVLGLQNQAIQRPQALLTSLIHAREPVTLSITLYFIGRSLDQFSRDLNTEYLLRHREVWIIPFINPDGYIENEKRGRGNRDVKKKIHAQLARMSRRTAVLTSTPTLAISGRTTLSAMKPMPALARFLSRSPKQ